ncbi:hypothetical protein [Labilithrix luteola]|nr:hypothetical protein [Labilithrix luteola]
MATFFAFGMGSFTGVTALLVAAAVCRKGPVPQQWASPCLSSAHV